MTGPGERHETPVELRFIDLFLIIVAAMVFLILLLAFRGSEPEKRPRIISQALPPALREQPYSVALSAAGDTQPWVWRQAGPLPAGLALRDGTIEGIPGEVGTFPLAVELVDAKGRADSVTLQLRVLPISPELSQRPLTVDAPAAILPDGKSGSPYSHGLSTLGGAPPYRWALEAGALPPGLSLAPGGDLVGVLARATSPLLMFQHGPQRQQKKREIFTRTFTVSVTDRQGQRVPQRLSLYVEPLPAPFLLQLISGDFASPPHWLIRFLSFLISLILPSLLALTCFLAFLVAVTPLAQLAFGFEGGEIEGWRGLWNRPVPNEERPTVGPFVAAYACAVRRLLEMFRNPKGSRDGPPADERNRMSGGIGEDGVPQDPGATGGSPAPSGGSGQEQPLSPAEEDYLESLRKGGFVPQGGAFLGLPFLRAVQLPETLQEAFEPLPEVGRGLLHVSLDRFFQGLLGAHERRGEAFQELDPRFDVVQGRKGPAPPPKLTRQERRPAAPPQIQGRMVLPRELCGQPEASGQLGRSLEDSARQARRWMARLLSQAGLETTENQIRRILRRGAHVQLKGEVLHVRLGRFRTRHTRETAERMCQILNREEPRTLGRFPFAVRFGVMP